MPDPIQYVQQAGGAPTDIASIEKELGITAASDPIARLKAVSEAGAYSPVAAPVNQSEVVDTIVDSNKNIIVSGTDTARDERTNELNQFASDLQIAGATLKGGFSDVDTMNEIQAAREAAKRATQYLVEGAQEARRTTLPRDIVRAGERGGFESTQEAGIAALRPTDPATGEAFVGAGGELDETRQNLDRAVIAAKRAQQEAMDRAELAARKAIRSRRQDDYTVAKDMYTVAFDAKKYADEVERDKRNFDQKVEQFERISGRLETATIYSIVKDIPEGETITIGGQTFTGIKRLDIDPFFTGANIISLMKSLPAGEESTIIDPNTGREFIIVGLSQEDPNVKAIQSTDDSGNVTITSYDAGTGEIIKQVDAGQIGKTKTQAANISLTLNEQRIESLGAAIDRLESTKTDAGFYNISDAIKEVQDFSIQNPGKEQNIIDAVKNKLDPSDPQAAQLITGKLPIIDPLTVYLDKKMGTLENE